MIGSGFFSLDTSLSFCFLIEWRETTSWNTGNKEYAPDGELCVQYVHAFDTDYPSLSSGEFAQGWHFLSLTVEWVLKLICYGESTVRHCYSFSIHILIPFCRYKLASSNLLKMWYLMHSVFIVFECTPKNTSLIWIMNIALVPTFLMSLCTSCPSLRGLISAITDYALLSRYSHQCRSTMHSYFLSLLFLSFFF